MEQGPLLQQHVPIDLYTQSSDNDYNDQYHAHAHAHAHQSAYTTAGAVDPLRRDGTAPFQAPAPFSFPPANPRFHADRGVASEASSYQPSNNFTDSSSGSISTSPSSAASSVAYPGYGQPHCTSISSFPGSVPLPQAFAQLPSYAKTRVPPILESHMLPPPHPIRSPISSSTNATDREAYASSTPFLARTQLSPGTLPGYPSFADTPRTTLGLSGLSLSNHANAYSSSHMASPPYAGPQNDCGNFPWPTLEVQAEMTCEGQPVTPDIHAKVEKGFFLSNVDSKWTCYRRNYFSVQCSFDLHPNVTNGRMYLKRTNIQHAEQIQAMGMRLSAAVDGSGGKSIELIQHTPKRDNGPKTKIDITKVSPTPSSGSRGDHAMAGHYQMAGFHPTGQIMGPYLPLQSSGDGSSGSAAAVQGAGGGTLYGYSTSAASHMPVPGHNTSQTFERVQFKQATANNGKRRASQQYFHLIVELYADVRKDGSDQPLWVKVAHRVSEKIVVRGRSPSHYQNEGHHTQNGRTGSTSGGSGYGGGGGGAAFGGLSASGFRASTSSYGGGIGGNNYRTNAYGYNASPEHSGSSASSVDGGADNEYQADAAMSDVERNDIQSHEGYRYYPGPLYEGGVPQGLPLPKIESGARFSTEPSQWAVKYENSDAVPGSTSTWSSNAGGVSRFHGVDSSRGYYPDMTSSYAG